MTSPALSFLFTSAPKTFDKVINPVKITCYYLLLVIPPSGLYTTMLMRLVLKVTFSMLSRVLQFSLSRLYSVLGITNLQILSSNNCCLKVHNVFKGRNNIIISPHVLLQYCNLSHFRFFPSIEYCDIELLRPLNNLLKIPSMLFLESKSATTQCAEKYSLSIVSKSPCSSEVTPNIACPSNFKPP